MVEVGDGSDEYNATHSRVSFFYDLAKAAVNRMAFALGHELSRYGCSAVSVTPGWLRSEAMLEIYGATESNWRDATKNTPDFAISETPAYVGRWWRWPLIRTLRAGSKSLSTGQLAKIYGFTDVDGSQPDAWRYMVEVQEAGKPSDATAYR